MLNFAAHRQKLVDRMKPGSIAIIPSASEKSRNSDVHYPFRQNSNFFYLTGFNEPNSVAVLIKENDNKVNYILFNQDKNPTQEIWTGKRAGQAGAVTDFGATQMAFYKPKSWIGFDRAGLTCFAINILFTCAIPKELRLTTKL